ncbi:MAG: NAD-dependent DNA ligase LigA [Leptospiraceae bacterium]|nr:NAD-dependent DNA ligase LigA [Leptospiraceae bacterium]MDW7976508.1 NAD-dependent DNA ligase LigA [Leptospiraceae bacterium]
MKKQKLYYEEDLFLDFYKVPPKPPQTKNPEEIRDYIKRLTDFLKFHQHLYYVKNRPIISNKTFDEKLKELEELEKQFPEFAQPDSPTHLIGSDLDQEFPKFQHKIPVLSLNNVYTPNEALSWAQKTESDSFIVEWKVDGATLVLYYVDGILQHAVTRGTGNVGDEVTGNAKTIRSIPIQLKEKVSLIVRGEAYMTYSDFERFNEEYGSLYANPRNLTSGSLKHKKSKEVALRPIRWVAFDGYIEHPSFMYDSDVLLYMKNLGFPVFEDNVVCSLNELPKVISEFQKKEKEVPFPVDGLVIKVNNRILREELGYTANSPRWAIAYKFEPEVGRTKILDIETFVGRTGRVTPRAKLKPIKLAGTTVSYATLHNEDFIKNLGIRIGSEVLVSKRGDIIPAVEEVVDPGEGPEFEFPKVCPSCKTELRKEKEGVDWFCPNPECEEKLIETLIYFCSRKQMDITGLGEKTIRTLFKKGFIRYIEDIYELPKYKKELIQLDNFGEKSVQIILNGIEASKNKPFRVVLPSLGLKDIGNNVTELLLDHGFTSIDKIIALVKEPNAKEILTSIKGIGDEIADSIIKQFQDPKILARIEKLRSHNLQLEENTKKENENYEKIFLGQTWCITGSFEHFKPREKAIVEIQKRGGKISNNVNKKTTHLLVGDQPGSKLEKAKELGIRIVTEKEFLELIK